MWTCAAGRVPGVARAQPDQVKQRSAMNKTTGQIHLIVETAPVSLPPRTRAATETPLPALPVPADVLTLQAAHPPQLQVHSGAAPPGLALEPLALPDGQPRLLLLQSGAARLRVNGNPAPRLSLLRERDQFQFDDSCVFHVAIFHRPQMGPAPADKLGKPCPICLTPFSEDPNSISYRCPCGTVLHLQDPSGLECARAVHDCPHCHQPISLQEGYSWLPPLNV